MANLTDAKLRSLKAKGERYEVFDGDGFGVRVAPSGRKSFIWVYHFKGHPRRLTLGRYAGGTSNPADDVLSLSDARLKAAAARKALDAGRDPGTEITERRKADRDADTFAELAALYVERWAKPRKRSWKEDERILAVDVTPQWKGRKAKDIKRRDIARMLDRIVKRGAPVAANRALACVRKVFNFAIGADVAGIEVNPCHQIQRPAPENRRDRQLSDAEIKTFWTGLEGSGMMDGNRRALRLQLVTAQRKGEIVQIEPHELDLDEMTWTIPPKKSKNGRGHVVPLSPLAAQIIQEQLKARPKGSRYLFPARFQKDEYLSSHSLSHALHDNLETIGLADVTPHDLRRTAATKTAELIADTGDARFIIGRILNHADNTVTAIYDLHAYLAQKRKALDAWAVRLQELIAAPSDQTNVVRLAS